MSDPEIRYEMDPEALTSLKEIIPELEKLGREYFKKDPLMVTRLVSEAMTRVMALGHSSSLTDTQITLMFALTQMIPLVIQEVEKNA